MLHIWRGYCLFWCISQHRERLNCPRWRFIRITEYWEVTVLQGVLFLWNEVRFWLFLLLFGLCYIWDFKVCCVSAGCFCRCVEYVKWEVDVSQPAPNILECLQRIVIRQRRCVFGNVLRGQIFFYLRFLGLFLRSCFTRFTLLLALLACVRLRQFS